KTRARAPNPDTAVQPPPADTSHYEGNPEAPPKNVAQVIDERNRDTGVQAPPAAPSPFNMNVEALAKNMAQLIEEGNRAVVAYLRPRDSGARKMDYSNEIVDVVTTLGHVAEYWYADPQRTVEMQTRLGKSFLDLFAS